MDLDQIDIFILRRILKRERISTWTLAKEYHWKESDKFCQMSKLDLVSFYQNKSKVIEYRLKQMVKEGFVLIEKEGTSAFIIDSSRIRLGSKVFLTGKKECIEIMFSDGKCVIFEI
jgi:hypothetical protein